MPVAVACSDTTDDGYTIPDGYKLLSNEIVDFYMLVPDEWIVDLSTGVVSAKCSSLDPTNVTVITQELDSSLKLDEYWTSYGAKNAGLLGEISYITEGNSLLLNCKNDKTVAAKRYTYSATLNETVYIFDQVVCIYRNCVYLITLTATETNYTDAHKAEFKDMLDRFLFRV